MCGTNVAWTPKANHAKCIGIAVLVFGVIDCLAFLAGGWLAGLAALLAVIASSLIVCCGPPQPGPGMGQKFRTAAIMSIIAAVLHFGGAIWMAAIAVAFHTTPLDENCIDNYCANGQYASQYCSGSATYYCSSESECRSDSNVQSLCGAFDSLANSFVAAILWPVIVITLVQGILELAFGINCFQAVQGMEVPPQQPTMSVAQPAQPVAVAQPAYAQPVAQPAYAQPVATAYGQPMAVAQPIEGVPVAGPKV